MPDSAPWRNEAFEEEVRFSQEIVHAARASRAQYQLPPKATPQVFIKTGSAEVESVLVKYAHTIGTLVGSSSLTVLGPNSTEAAPATCAIVPVGGKCDVLINLAGLVDFAKEKAKLEEKQVRLQGQVAKLREAMAADGYEKVPDNIKDQNKDKLQGLEAEVASIATAIQALGL
eukprot:Colp12_sorted_trinity150504_noHs@13604